MKSVFVPLALPEAKKAIALYDLKGLGIELVPIPAMGGCVIAIREVLNSGRVNRPRTPRFAIRWLERLQRVRSERRAISVLENLSLIPTGGDA